ncbi:MAG: hypothetical protein DRH44_08005 [Candidatus Coatesbacteria bacterium]|nr:MAG: hypothetical protein DRH49_07655 [Candidatus Coatesbacteria bacterium]RLC40909.1 MAG: hypothetical protein DRH44_08005 [Candidatus Coatesbacteria bacterium]
MWLKVDYHPASLFSFRNIRATGSGATTLLCPTPFAVKSALVDVAIKTKGIKYGKSVFENIRASEIRFKLPDICVVNKTIIRIFNLDNRFLSEGTPGHTNDLLRALRDENGNAITDNPVKPAFREFVYFKGNLSIAINVSDFDDNLVEELIELFRMVNYFGKKGSFMQFLNAETCDALEDGFLQRMDEKRIKKVGNRNFLLTVEDTNENISFNQINVFDSTETLKRTEQIGHYYLLVPAEEILSGKRYKYIRVR